MKERTDRHYIYWLTIRIKSVSMFLQIVISSHHHLSQSKFFRTPCNTFFAIEIIIESTSSAPCSFFLFSLTWRNIVSTVKSSTGELPFLSLHFFYRKYEEIELRRSSVIKKLDAELYSKRASWCHDEMSRVQCWKGLCRNKTTAGKFQSSGFNLISDL